MAPAVRAAFKPKLNDEHREARWWPLAALPPTGQLHPVVVRSLKAFYCLCMRNAPRCSCYILNGRTYHHCSVRPTCGAASEALYWEGMQIGMPLLQDTYSSTTWLLSQHPCLHGIQNCTALSGYCHSGAYPCSLLARHCSFTDSVVESGTSCSSYTTARWICGAGNAVGRPGSAEAAGGGAAGRHGAGQQQHSGAWDPQNPRRRGGRGGRGG